MDKGESRYSDDPTQRGDQIAYEMREYYEANRPLRWWEKRNPPGSWGEVADELMLGLQNIVLNAEREYRAQTRELLACAETDRLTRELDITNADHIAMWLESNTIPDEPMNQCISWLACRIVEAHEAATRTQLDELRAALRPFAAAAHLLTSGVHNGGIENVREFPTGEEWRAALSLFPEFQGAVRKSPDELRKALGGTSHE